METLLGTSTAPSNFFFRSPSNIQVGCYLLSSQNGYSSSSFAVSIGSRSSRNHSPVIAMAKKGDDKKKKKKVDNHSFVPKPDEATGPFPEAVLLREKKLQEDGSILPDFADEEEQELFQFLNLQLESDLQEDRMRHYEVVYLIHQDHDQQVEKVNSKIQDFLKEKKGKLWRFSDWGMRRLAYKIQKATHAHYILMNLEMEAQWINEFKTMLDQDERVIRHLVIKRDKAITEDCPPPPEFHTLRGEGDDEYEEEEDDDEEDDEEWDDEEEEEEVEIEVLGAFDDEREVEEKNLSEEDEDDDGDNVRETKQPARVEAPRKKDKKIAKAVR